MQNQTREQKLQHYLAHKHSRPKSIYLNPSPSFHQMLRNPAYDLNKINKINRQAERRKQRLIQRAQMEAKIDKVKVEKGEHHEIHEMEQQPPVIQPKLVNTGSFWRYMEVEFKEQVSHIVPVRRSVRLDRPCEPKEYSADQNYIVYQPKGKQNSKEIYCFQSVLDHEFHRQMERQADNIQQENMKVLRRTRSLLRHEA